MKCDRAQELIPLHSGDDLEDPEDRTSLNNHLEDCPDCTDILGEFQDTRDVLQRFVPETTSDSFWEEYNQELEERLQEEEDLSSRVNRNRESHSGASGKTIALFGSGMFKAAAAVLLAVGIGFAGWYATTGPADVDNSNTRDQVADNKDNHQPEKKTDIHRKKDKKEVTKETPEKPANSGVEKNRESSGTLVSERFNNKNQRSPHKLREFSVPLRKGRTFFLGQSRSMKWDEFEGPGPSRQGQKVSIDF